MSSTSKLMFTPYTDANAGVTGTPIELVFESGRSDGWDELTDGDIALPPGNPDGNSNFIAWNAPNTASTGGKVYTLNGDSLAERSFEIRVENGNANLYIEFDPAELIANFDKVIILDALAPSFPAPPGPPAASGENATIDLLTESRSGAYTAYPGYYEFSTSSTGKRRIGIVSSLLYFIQVIPKAGGVSADPIEFSTSATFSALENQTSVGTVQASGGDGATLSYSITGGADNTKFSIVSSTGVLTFNNAPDFETPGSNAGTNAYAIIVTATDGTTPVAQNITVNITDVTEDSTADPIEFSTSATFSALENQTSVGTVQASGGDGATLSYSITGGADNTKFSIVSSTGVLTFNNAPDFETPGSNAGTNAYAIIVTATDGTTPVTQNITVNITDVTEDSTPPVITLNGQPSSNHEVGSPYEDATTASDNAGVDITSSMTTTITKDGEAFGDDVSTIGYVTGTYVIKYNVSDAAGNTATQVTSTVTVADTNAPTINLEGDATVTITVGQSYSDAGATASDTYDQSSTISISITITKNGAAFNDDITTIGNAVGTYEITYSAQDAAGNTAQVTRTVTVEAAPVTDITAPVINLNGASTITLTVGQTYTELVSATDNVDGTVPVTIGGTVDTGVAGTYTLTYDATDAAQNTAAQVTRTVTVVAATDTTWGDITNDGSIGAADVVYLASYLAGESGFIHGGPSAPAS